jgi:hypothetical protein
MANWVTTLSVEQIDEKIKTSEQHISILQQKIKEQEDLKQELLLMKLDAQRNNSGRKTSK